MVLKNLKNLHTIRLGNNTYSNITALRFLPRLQTIHYPLGTYNLSDRWGANRAYAQLSLYNFLKTKHNYYPTVIFFTAFALLVLENMMIIGLKNSLEDC